MIVTGHHVLAEVGHHEGTLAMIHMCVGSCDSSMMGDFKEDFPFLDFMLGQEHLDAS